MVQTRDKFPPFGSSGNSGISCRLQNQLGLRAGVLGPEVSQKLEEAHIPRQIGLADATEHSQVRFEQGKEALGLVLMHLPTGVFLLRMIDRSCTPVLRIGA